MNVIKRRILKTHLQMLLYNNHMRWWVEDNIAERMHLLLDSLDSLYWRSFWMMRGLR